MMQVYCTDGTVFECERYEVTEFGLAAYGQDKQPRRDRYDDEESEQIAFVPHDKLWYVLPAGVAPQTGPAAPQQSHPDARATNGQPTQQRQ